MSICRLRTFLSNFNLYVKKFYTWISIHNLRLSVHCALSIPLELPPMTTGHRSNYEILIFAPKSTLIPFLNSSKRCKYNSGIPRPLPCLWGAKISLERPIFSLKKGEFRPLKCSFLLQIQVQYHFWTQENVTNTLFELSDPS